MAALFPTRPSPTPALETAGDREVLVERIAATVIDVGLCYLLFTVPLLYVPRLLSDPVTRAFSPLFVVVSLVLLVPIHSTYAFAFEWQYSRTPGKVARGLMVATTDGRPCTRRGSAVRNLVRYVDMLPGPYLVGLASALRSPDGQRIGDVLAGTVVVATADATRSTTGDG